MKKNSEVRIQEQSRRRSASGQNQDARSSLTLTLHYQLGIQTRDFLVDHQIENLVGVQKRRLFRRFLRDAKSVACFSVKVRGLALSVRVASRREAMPKALRWAIRQSYRIQNEF
ncbi:hypothetical protein [uncultured Nostoc sp.]|uniref:hypothetical protein n=1 Tax=uncultured Nostoc sp. TaxID=340711 RepID=UPI0035CA39A3